MSDRKWERRGGCGITGSGTGGGRCCGGRFVVGTILKPDSGRVEGASIYSTRFAMGSIGKLVKGILGSGSAAFENKVGLSQAKLDDLLALLKPLDDLGTDLCDR